MILFCLKRELGYNFCSSPFQHQKSNRKLNQQNRSKWSSLVRRRKVQFKAKVRTHQLLITKVSITPFVLEELLE